MSKRKRNFINVISGISFLIVAVCTAALIIVLSVFNGLENLLHSIYGTFDPEIKVSLVEGKSFHYTDSLKHKIEKLDGIGVVTDVIEDYAYVKYRDSDMVVTLKGVNENFLDQGRINQSLVSGDLKLTKGDLNYAIIGRGIQYALSIMPNNSIYPLQVHYIRDIRAGSIDMNSMYSKKNILPGGVFAVEKNYDENYIIAPVRFVQDLLDYGNQRTSLEIQSKPGYDAEQLKKDLKEVLGDTFNVLDNEEQHADLYKILKLEKLFVFLALVLILGVGSINIFFALSMLVLDKKKDIAVLYAMGAQNSLIRRIFLFEGALISFGGAASGIFLGWLFCWIQQTYGLVSMGMQSSVLDQYPVKMELFDFVFTALSIVVITLIISYRPATIATQFKDVKYL